MIQHVSFIKEGSFDSTLFRCIAYVELDGIFFSTECGTNSIKIYVLGNFALIFCKRK